MIKKLDFMLSSLIPIKTQAFVDQKNNNYIPGEQILSAKDWSESRKMGYRGIGNDAESINNDEKYLEHLFSYQERNLYSCLRFSKYFELTGIKSILEIGCGDMTMAFVFNKIHPQITYTASDFDSYIVSAPPTPSLK